MHARQLPSQPNLEQYRKQAKDLVKARRSADKDALRRIQRYHPRFRTLPEAEFPGCAFALTDAQLVIAREHGFESWPKFVKHIEALAQSGSSISKFEFAADAVIEGNAETLQRLLRDDPKLIQERSTREHRATLLHYVSANGVEDYRQKCPGNALEIAKILLKAGAEVNAPANAYGKSTALGLVATSIHPARAGVQIDLLQTLIAAGASVDGAPGGWNPLNAALANGRPEAAEFLAHNGARIDLEGAAGLGRLDLVKTFFNQDGSLKSNAAKAQLESGFMWACEYGRVNVVEFLLNSGFAVDTQASGMTGLHWAVIGGHLDTIKFLLRCGAPLEVKNHYGGTVLGQATWAVTHSDPVCRWPKFDPDWAQIIQLLIDSGARIEEADFPTGNGSVDAVLRRHGAR